MTIQITIIGLGQIGASIGLALKDHKELVRRVGHDRQAAVARQAEKMGAVDQVSLNLPASIRQADLVLLTEPVDELLETLKVIADELREGAVVMDTAPVKANLIAQAVRLLPPERHYISLLPAINPAYLLDPSAGPESARADLFKGGLIFIAEPANANPEAIKLAGDLTNLLGASPLFADAAEVDGLAAAAILLPALIAAAVVNATIPQPGWREARKLAGGDYARVSAPMQDLASPAGLAKALALNPENAVRLLDDATTALADLRQAIQRGDETTLQSLLEGAHDLREEWWKQRASADWQAEENPQPRQSSGDIFSRLAGLRRGSSGDSRKR
jgi:prephenate dehydrogenase